jgi:hypothetical protein
VRRESETRQHQGTLTLEFGSLRRGWMARHISPTACLDSNVAWTMGSTYCGTKEFRTVESESESDKAVDKALTFAFGGACLVFVAPRTVLSHRDMASGEPRSVGREIEDGEKRKLKKLGSTCSDRRMLQHSIQCYLSFLFLYHCHSIIRIPWPCIRKLAASDTLTRPAQSFRQLVRIYVSALSSRVHHEKQKKRSSSTSSELTSVSS